MIAARRRGAALSPTLGVQRRPPSFKAVDFEWVADGGPGNELTIAPGETVAFAYPSGRELSQRGLRGHAAELVQRHAARDPRPGWSGSCRFDEAGTYRFVCGVHPEMTGRVIVRTAPTPTPTPTIDPGGSPAPTATPARRPPPPRARRTAA